MFLLICQVYKNLLMLTHCCKVIEKCFHHIFSSCYYLKKHTYVSDQGTVLNGHSICPMISITSYKTSDLMCNCKSFSFCGQEWQIWESKEMWVSYAHCTLFCNTYTYSQNKIFKLIKKNNGKLSSHDIDSTRQGGAAKHFRLLYFLIY